MLHILPGEEKQEKTASANVEGRSTFQKAKFAKLKKNAGKAHSWNTLFLGANAVAETLAEKLDVVKSDLLLGVSETSAGVRLALAETRLVRETRDFLLANGVCLDAFSRPAVKRSDTVIIAKNLPGCVSAIVEMENTVDAKKAFDSLAYAKLRTQPLYLEWAPCDVFITEETSAKETEVQNEEQQTTSQVEKTEDKRELRRSKKHRLKKEQPAESQQNDGKSED
ncbi:unnamed protein product, partial [Gongylonema pulchrum]|uniref:Alba domain-containing protein n=1 Tax=Gongylonema pulchrum TaxID=637853 RepID=A0A183ERT9_9BILA